MKRELIGLSRRYLMALRQHLKQGPLATVDSARGFGRQAVAIGLETLDVARMHEEALAALEASSSRDGIIKRAEMFFAEAITPIEKTHHAALKANVHLTQLNKTLGRRTVDLAATNRSLKQRIAQRKAAEEALKKRGAHSAKLLKESRELQKHLQHLTHRFCRRRKTNERRSATICRMKSPRRCWASMSGC